MVPILMPDMNPPTAQHQRSSKGWFVKAQAALIGATSLMSVALFGSTYAQGQTPQRPNIVVIMGDDIGI